MRETTAVIWIGPAQGSEWIGTPIAMMGALFLTMFFEKILTNP